MRGLICILFGLFCASLQAATVNYVQTSVNDADGSTLGAVASNQWLVTGSSYSTTNAPATYGAYRFTHWTISSYASDAYRDAWGRSLNPVTFVLYEDTTATAHYLPASWDSDTDGVPDWFETEYYGNLANGADSDTDGDAITLLSEYVGGTSPIYANSSQDGGVAWVDSSSTTVNLGGFPRYTITSVPEGVVAQSAVVRNGTTVTTPNMTQSGFGYWELDGARQQDAWGAAVRQISFTVNGADRTAVAYFFVDDSDGDGVNDGYEQFYYGTLANDASSDTDGDGVALLQEYMAGTTPLFGESHQDGGVAWVDSSSTTVNLGGFPRYTITSVPEGVVAQSAVVRNGTMVTTPNMTQSEFGYWELDGVRQQDAWGAGLRQISFTVNGADRTAVAYFFVDDSDGDGVNDGYEQYYYGTLANDASSDTDGDGVALLQEYMAGTTPLFGESHQDGGVAWVDSGLLVANLQPHDRLSKAVIDGILTNFFSPDPDVVTGYDFGSWSSPALTDWDGDGDMDLFVAGQEGLRVFRNIGTSHNPNFREVTSGFEGLSAYIASISRPVISGGDWNGDGWGDLVVGGNTGTLRLIASDGVFGSSGDGIDFVVGSARARASLADINKDGKQDLLVLLDDGTVQLYLNNGTSVPFTGAGTTNLLGIAAPEATGISAGDINRDGLVDVLLSDAQGRIWEFAQKANGSFSLLSKVWGGTYAGFANSLTIAVGDLEGDGDLDIIGGLANGGLIALRDPGAGRPSGLKATAGATSILLDWNPNSESRIRGYFVYRALSADGPWEEVRPDYISLPSYLDTAVSAPNAYYYYVSGVSYFYRPGNSQPIVIESMPSDIVGATPGNVTVSVKPVRGKSGKTVKVMLSIDNSVGLLAEGMDLSINYDPAKLTPLAQVSTGSATVDASGLSKDVLLTDNGAVASGTLRIQGVSGTMKSGSGVMFTLNFVVGSNIPAGSVLNVVLTSAVFKDELGNTIGTLIDNSGSVEVGSSYVPGDINGDGAVDENDEALLKALITPQSRTPTASELLAGDLNGDGKLDQKDLSLLKQLTEEVRP